MIKQETLIRVHVYGVVAICPQCGGAMSLLNYAYYRCWDCKSMYQIDSEGIADREVTVKKVEMTK